MDQFSTGWKKWKSITISVPLNEPSGVPVVSGDFDFFRPILASVVSGGKYWRFGKIFGGEVGMDEGGESSVVVMDERREEDEGMDESREEILREENIPVNNHLVAF